MTASPLPDPQAKHLLKVLEQQSSLTCEEARAQLPALVEAELSGVDADTIPEFSALLRHLDTCQDCVALYSALSEELATVTDLAGSPVPGDIEEQLRPASVLVTVRESADVALSKLRGVANWFRLQLTLPAPPLPSALSSAEGLFGDTVTEVDAQPVVSVSLSGAGELRDVLVVAQADAPVRWRVHLTIGGMTRSATIDANGLARFEALPRADLQRLTLTFEPLPEEPSAPPP